MNNLPKRTGLSELTDDELLILDFLATEGSCNIAILRKDNYPVHMNCNYTHNISDKEINQKMNDIAMKGWVIPKGCITLRTKDTYSITEEGGRLWEIERTPIWERYCIDSSYPDEADENLHFMEINSVNKDIGLQFAACLQNCGIYNFNFDELEITSPDIHFLPWRKFKYVFAWKARLEEAEQTSTNWDHYERKRTWWRGINELQKFLA